MLVEGPPAMPRACTRFLSFRRRSMTKKPRKSNLARHIPGGPSANRGPQGDRCRNGRLRSNHRKQQGPEARGLASRAVFKNSQQLRFHRLHLDETAQVATIDE